MIMTCTALSGCLSTVEISAEYYKKCFSRTDDICYTWLFG